MAGGRIVVRVLLVCVVASALAGCSSGDSSEPERTDGVGGSSSAASPDDAQAYLDAVNALCDDLLPAVVDATHGGSTDVPATEWVATWPAHLALLDAFDADLAAVPVPEAAEDAARVVSDYVAWASGVDRARIAAAEQGEDAWRARLAAEADITSAPELLALGPAGFHDSCQAR